MKRLGIIGMGIMGRRLAAAAAVHPGWEVSAAWDPAPVGDGVPWVADAAAVIAASDAVHVASPPSSHLLHGRAVLAAGRALLMEKPLSHDTPASRDFVAWAAGRPAAVNFPMASSPGVAQLHAWLPEIGRVRGVEIRLSFREWPRPWQAAAATWLDGRAEGGFVREVASHFVWLAQRICGPLVLEEAQCDFPEPGRSERAAWARLRAGEVPVALEGRVGGTEADDANLCTFDGEAGQLRLRDWSIAERWDGHGWVPAPDARPNAEARLATLAGQLDRLTALTHGQVSGMATLEEALAVQEVVEAMLRG